MQLKDQFKQPRNWKVVGTMAVSAALGISGLALAVPGGAGDVNSIDLQDPATLDRVTSTSVPPTTQALMFEDLASPLQVQPPTTTTRAGGRDLDSPFDSPTPSPDSPSPDSPPSPASPSPASPASPASPSPDSPSPDSPPSPATPSPDSPDSPRSPASPDSPDSGSADSGSADSFG